MNRLDFDGLDGSLVLPAYDQGSARLSTLDSDEDGDQPAYADSKTTDFTAYTDSFPLTERHYERVDKDKGASDDMEQSENPLFYDNTEPLRIETTDSDQNGGSLNKSSLLQKLTAAFKASGNAPTKRAFNREIAEDPVVPSLKDRIASEPAAEYPPSPSQNQASQRVKRLLTIAAAFVAGLLIGGASLLAWLGRDNEIPLLGSVDKSPVIARERENQIEAIEPSEQAGDIVSLSPSEQVEKDVARKSGVERTSETPQVNNEGGASEQPVLQTQGDLETGRTPPEQKPDSSPPQHVSIRENTAGTEGGASTQQLADEIPQKALPAHTNAQSTSWTIPVSFDSLDVPGEAVAKLKDQLLLCDKGLLIIGHTCSLGEAETNYYVGLARAKSVRKTLTELGFPDDRLKVDSAGASQPVATNATEEGRQANRRVVISCRLE
jgi:outer membrane protein OmpA-like peptidoglycan-associated protein